ncbi:MAG: adenylate cyclase [Spirochaetes bacterium GWD1_61_31]|nr:MAG: adenylate cyclase [Spirochaetes bacterium GWB1_60_80]OHD29675.1 MAG: adenylate cyclase [Spirochaetes bacterium GWC1_61_12]OHD37553.1 MAG: adenylate cyclase [Spirochaetes bacterium GWD1_61_31]OHD42024.1 MAG: adenylate cyclase [Spirochaetes bacterium GWE1_60_18]OHD61864.1 MAG: adenylate cyclase [Spirochaetes bacterium GWF1_60_12]
MSTAMRKFFGVKTFSFIIGIFVVALVLALSEFTGIFESIEDKILDSHFKLKVGRDSKSVQEGAVLTQNSMLISNDILIIGIDQRSLEQYGKWPFERTRFAHYINAFSRISDQNNRESALFLDFFFNERDPNPTHDALLADSVENSGRVFVETVLVDSGSLTETDPLYARQKILYDTKGTLANVVGDWKKIHIFSYIDPPLGPIGQAAAGYGHANYRADPDKIYRRQPLILRSSVLLKTIKLEEITAGYSVNESSYERLAWIDFNGMQHEIETPITEAALERLKITMQKNAPMVSEVDSTNEIDSYYIIRHYQDFFVPAVTLSLALNYFHVGYDQIIIELGSHILIKNPRITFTDEEGNSELRPYRIRLTDDSYDADGNFISEGRFRDIPEIRIPINEAGQMLVNFMGPGSSASPEGNQTFPVRSFAAYANRDPGSDVSHWRRTMASTNKILMTGAFSSGMADDEKPTPLGMMFGIEIHANALNTILMDNFIINASYTTNLLILCGFVFFMAFLTSRISAALAFFIALFQSIAYFLVVNAIFEKNAYLINYSGVALGSFFTFISVVIYRVFTEEREKKKIRQTFGKYLSPKVVEQLAENPPELGGQDKELTVFFSDIRGFTTLSENMTPQELVNHLNVYLTAMTDIIIQYGGTLDKYMGDAIMCFWGAPIALAEHAVLACKCALKQMQALKKLNQEWPESKNINIGIGLNSGIMTVGNMGSKMHMNYTLMGDHVNLGSRLESINKEYGTQIIISEFTYAQVRDKFIVRELDNIRVKGKNKPVVIYELVDCLESIEPPNKK